MSTKNVNFKFISSVDECVTFILGGRVITVNANKTRVEGEIAKAAGMLMRNQVEIDFVTKRIKDQLNKVEKVINNKKSGDLFDFGLAQDQIWASYSWAVREYNGNLENLNEWVYHLDMGWGK